MANYRTNTAELTSIADAIRAKTGENLPLVYPSGFVSAIEGISTSGNSAPYTWLGENATLIDTVYEHTYKLSDTSFDASTVTTSNTTLVAATNLETQYLSADYDYMEVVLGIIDYQYLTNITDTPHYVEGYWCGVYPFGRKPYATSDFENNTMSYVSSGCSYGNGNLLYKAANNTNNWTSNMYGITLTLSGPSMSNATQNTFGVILRTPIIRINSNSSYMSSTAINALDAENTTIYIKEELYRCTRNDVWNGINTKTIELYKQKHNIT